MKEGEGGGGDPPKKVDFRTTCASTRKCGPLVRKSKRGKEKKTHIFIHIQRGRCQIVKSPWKRNVTDSVRRDEERREIITCECDA